MTRGPDVYYGSVAANYDASRSSKAKWRTEAEAAEQFITAGPVLDVPFGTGRFVPLYRAKGLDYHGVDISPDMLALARAKYGAVNCTAGSVHDLTDGEFATAVCVRFLEWIPPSEAKRVLDRLRQRARVLVVTINHGVEGEPEAFTYDLGKFLEAIDGLLIDARRITAQVPGITSEMFRLRPAAWDDVLAQFEHDHPGSAAENIQRIADKLGGFFGLPSITIDADTVTVRAQYWAGDRIAEAVRALAPFRFLKDEAPRRDDMPATVLVRDGIALIVDGRHRANAWMTRPGPHPVLVMRPKW